MPAAELRSSSKSLIEIFWGLALSLGGGFLLFASLESIGEPTGWLMLGFGILLSLIGIYMLFAFSRIHLNPADKKWKEVSGWLVFSSSKEGNFADFANIVVKTEQGKSGPYYTISIVGRTADNRRISLIYDVVHSEQRKNEIQTQLVEVLQIPVIERTPKG